jgi:ferredoxin--NADP+ reductase
MSLADYTPSPNGPTVETVLSVRHYTDRLFMFRVTRPAALRFRSGEFVMIGLLGDDGRPILRAYSVASPEWDEELEFYSIKVPDGPLTSRLAGIAPGDKILLGRKPTGTLVLDALTPGKRLYMFSTGTGFAPFASLVRDPATYERFDEVIVTHTCRDVAELAYSAELVDALRDDPLGPFRRAEPPRATRIRSRWRSRCASCPQESASTPPLAIELFGRPQIRDRPSPSGHK